MIKKYILADLDDVKITETHCGNEAIQWLLSKSFDLVICNCDLEDMPITTFKRKMIEFPSKNRDVEVLVLVEPGDNAASLARATFENIIKIPFEAAVFIGAINQLCDPRKWRRTARFHIPDSKAVISVWGMEAETVMINISRGGVLVEVSGDRSDLLLQNDPKLTLKVNMPGRSYNIEALPVRLLRINVLEWNSNFKPILMRLAYAFLNLKSEVQTDLDQILQIAESDGYYTEGTYDC